MRRLRRNIGLGAVLGSLCVIVTPAAAAPAPTLFRVAVTAVVNQEWDYTAGPTTSGGCERTERSEGIRRVTFRTKTPSILRVVDGRFAGGELSAIAGTVSLVGANNDREVCDGVGRELIADCVRTRRQFAGARLRVTGGDRGALILTAARNVRLRNVQCPREPADVRRAPLGPLPISLRVRPATLMNPRIVRITLRATATRTVGYRAPEAGRLSHRSAWTVTLRRVS